MTMALMLRRPDRGLGDIRIGYAFGDERLEQDSDPVRGQAGPGEDARRPALRVRDPVDQSKRGDRAEPRWSWFHALADGIQQHVHGGRPEPLGAVPACYLAWCTDPKRRQPGFFRSVSREQHLRLIRDTVSPVTSWLRRRAGRPWTPHTTGPGGSGSPTTAQGNIWPATPICQQGYLQTQVVDFTVSTDVKRSPSDLYELKDQIALRNSTRCGTGTGSLAGPTLTVSAPTTGPVGTAINPSAILSGSASDTSPITFLYWKQPSAPTNCTTGGTTVGTATPSGDGIYPSSLSYTPTTNGDHIWWYASIPADSNNASATSVCGPGMPMTTVTAAPAHPSLSMSPPATASKGVLISPAAIQAPLSGSSGAVTGGITFYVIASASAPTSCPSGFTQVGTASPNGDGSWTPAAGYTPSSTTTLWWYATFAGDANDIATQSACGAGMPSTTVGLPAPNLTIAGPASGTSNVLIPASSITVTLAGSAGGTTAPIKVLRLRPLRARLRRHAPERVGRRSARTSHRLETTRITRAPDTRRLSAAPTTGMPPTQATPATVRPTRPAAEATMAATVVSGPNSFVFNPDRQPNSRRRPSVSPITATLAGRREPTPTFTGSAVPHIHRPD